ncbi:unnamed protein product [Leptosia nina]|uniref:Uncharacterized protein n=1 Tax=Leptosia nina TaxID=320188 RepID=A0AAV1K080_9NEOP
MAVPRRLRHPHRGKNKQMIIPKRSSNIFYRMVYGRSSSDDEDNVPFAQVKITSFKQLLPTPAKNTEKTPTVRIKGHNYRGIPVSKELSNKNNIVTHATRTKRLL